MNLLDIKRPVIGSLSEHGGDLWDGGDLFEEGGDI